MGDRFGPYTVYECLGAGGMATVHRATLAIGAGVIREVALKRLLPQFVDDKQFNEDFIREAKLAAQLDHPNIVHILELGNIAGTYFIAMELVRGQTLVELMKRAYATKIEPPIGVVVTLISELCEALHYASRGRGVYGQPLNIVHRDLTPSNLIVTDEGRVKIIDFGVAKALSGKFTTNTGMVKGKLGYMSIEALSGTASLDSRTDLFSLGVVAWELITSRRLFRGVNEYEVITKIRQGDVSPPSEHNADCPTELDDIVLKALARDREDRWASAAEMRAALDGVRRHYRASAADIGAWKHALIPSVRTVPRAMPDEEEETAFQLSSRDLFAEGSANTNPERVRPTRPFRVSAAVASQHVMVSEQPTVNGRPVTTDDEPTAVDATMGELPLDD